MTDNRSLLYDRQIKVLDVILVRFLIELLGGMMAFLVMTVVLIIASEFPIPANMGLLIAD